MKKVQVVNKIFQMQHHAMTMIESKWSGREFKGPTPMQN